MSRPLPLCAWCGETLRRRPKVTIEFTEVPGRPVIGWHIGCEVKDPCFKPLLDNGFAVNAHMVIEARGEGRISRRG